MRGCGGIFLRAPMRTSPGRQARALQRGARVMASARVGRWCGAACVKMAATPLGHSSEEGGDEQQRRGSGWSEARRQVAGPDNEWQTERGYLGGEFGAQRGALLAAEVGATRAWLLRGCRGLARRCRGGAARARAQPRPAGGVTWRARPPPPRTRSRRGAAQARAGRGSASGSGARVDHGGPNTGPQTATFSANAGIKTSQAKRGSS